MRANRSVREVLTSDRREDRVGSIYRRPLYNATQLGRLFPPAAGT